MKTCRVGLLATAMFLTAAVAWVTPGTGQATQSDEITGVVMSGSGPEEGVWVIAETDDLGTRFVKTVVTGDGGRFLIPELPEANYQVWVRGYGLVDSQKVDATRGADIELQATVAASEAEAAKVYPANYWYSLIEPPDASEFPGTGPSGNGIATSLQNQGQWIDIQKQGCMLCHQLGTQIVREIENIDEFDSSLAAWDYRVQMGQRGGQMSNVMSRFGRQRGLQMFADWSDRIASGALPPTPPRPQGVERNVVTTMWEWGTEVDYTHDEIASDKRGDQPRDPAEGRSGDRVTDDFAVDEGAVAVLWGGVDLGRPGQPAQSHDGPEGAGLDDVGDPRSSEPRVVPGGVGQQVRAVLPDGEQWAVRGLLRPVDRAVRHDRHLFRHAPSAVRRGQ